MRCKQNPNKDNVHPSTGEQNLAVAKEIMPIWRFIYADNCPLLTLVEMQHPGAFRGHTW